MSTNTRRSAEATEATDTEGPVLTAGGIMPQGSETDSKQNAYPETDATQLAGMPDAIADSMGDPTGNQSRDQLNALAQTQAIEGCDTMTRAELATALSASMTRADLVAGLNPSRKYGQVPIA